MERISRTFRKSRMSRYSNRRYFYVFPFFIYTNFLYIPDFFFSLFIIHTSYHSLCLIRYYINYTSSMERNKISIIVLFNICTHESFFTIAYRKISIYNQIQVRNMLSFAKILYVVHSCFFRKTVIDQDIILKINIMFFQIS